MRLMHCPSFVDHYNPDFDGKEIDEEGIVPGSLLMIQIMLDVVSGNETLLNHYREASGVAKAGL